MSKRRQIGMIAADMRDGDSRASREGDDEPGGVLCLSTRRAKKIIGRACHFNREIGRPFPAAPVRERLIGRRARQPAVAKPESSSAIDNSSALELAQ